VWIAADAFSVFYFGMVFRLKPFLLFLFSCSPSGDDGASVEIVFLGDMGQGLVGKPVAILAAENGVPFSAVPLQN
jgi:hypothetical protein